MAINGYIVDYLNIYYLSLIPLGINNRVWVRKILEINKISIISHHPHTYFTIVDKSRVWEIYLRKI